MTALLANYMWTEIAIRAFLISILTDSIGKIQHESDWQNVVLTSERDERPSRFRLHIGGVDDGESACRKPFRCDEVQHLEGVFRCCLVVLVVRDKAAAKVRGDNFRWFEVPRGKR